MKVAFGVKISDLERYFETANVVCFDSVEDPIPFPHIRSGKYTMIVKDGDFKEIPFEHGCAISINSIKISIGSRPLKNAHSIVISDEIRYFWRGTKLLMLKPSYIDTKNNEVSTWNPVICFTGRKTIYPCSFGVIFQTVQMPFFPIQVVIPENPPMTILSKYEMESIDGVPGFIVLKVYHPAKTFTVGCGAKYLNIYETDVSIMLDGHNIEFKNGETKVYPASDITLLSIECNTSSSK